MPILCVIHAQLENELGFEYVNHFLRLLLGFSYILHAITAEEELENKAV